MNKKRKRNKKERKQRKCVDRKKGMESRKL